MVSIIISCDSDLTREYDRDRVFTRAQKHHDKEQFAALLKLLIV
jgi:hypothetical protein